MGSNLGSNPNTEVELPEKEIIARKNMVVKVVEYFFVLTRLGR